MTKECPACSKVLDINVFNTQKTYCKPCHNLKSKMWRKTNKEKAEESRNKYLLKRQQNSNMRCGKCKKTLPVSEFSFKNKTLGIRASSCVTCQNIASKRHYQLNREKYISKSLAKRKELSGWFYSVILDKYKNGCITCGERNPIKLSCHHRNPKEKLFDLSSSFHRKGKKQILLELDKCDVVCMNCHAEITAKEQNFGLVQFINNPP